MPSRSKDSLPFLIARLYDLSELGVGLLTNTLEYGGFSITDPSRETSEPCPLEIEFPSREQPPLVRGKVVWYMRNPEGHPFAFRIGVQFLDLTPDLKRAIHSLIHLYHGGMGVS